MLYGQTLINSLQTLVPTDVCVCVCVWGGVVNTFMVPTLLLFFQKNSSMTLPCHLTLFHD